MTRIIIINKTAIMMVLLFLLAAPSAVHSLDREQRTFSASYPMLSRDKVPFGAVVVSFIKTL
jgi:hypothetical protein